MDKKIGVTRKQITLYFAQLLLLSISLVFSLSDGVSLMVLGTFSLINSIAVMLIITCCQRRIFTVYAAFMAFLSLFHFGQGWLYVFNASVDRAISYDVFVIYPQQEVYNVVSFCLMGYNLINLFAIGIINKGIDSISQRTVYELNRTYERHEVLLLGRLLFIILIVPVVIYDIQIVTITAEYGHSGLYENDISIWAAANSYYPLALILLILGSDPKKNRWKFVYYYAICRSLLLMILTGKRASMIIPLLINIYIRHEYIRRYNRRDILRLSAGGFILMMLVSFVSYGRGNYSNLNLLDFLLRENILVQTLSEFGSTLTSTVLAYQYTAKVGYLLGKSYLGALSVFIPLSDLLFSNIKKYISVSEMLNRYSPSGGALGGSLFGEMFINFGWYSLYITPMIGLFISKISNFLVQNKPKLIHRCMAIYLTYGIWICVRGNLVDVVFIAKRILYVYILFYVISMRRGLPSNEKCLDRI